MTYEIKDSGERQEYDTGARRDVRINKGRFDLLPWRTLWALAIHYEKGCDKYGDRNWEKGIPVSRFIDSAVRHIAQFLIGSSEENHLVSAIWNLCCVYDIILRIQEDMLPTSLYDLPQKTELPDPREGPL